eukprot:m.450743 g.450743  ORF g.450743 m.450743 type:complete len:300 (-) comp20322_c0_seq14:1134-2033(-)
MVPWCIRVICTKAVVCSREFLIHHAPKSLMPRSCTTSQCLPPAQAPWTPPRGRSCWKTTSHQQSKLTSQLEACLCRPVTSHFFNGLVSRPQQRQREVDTNAGKAPHFARPSTFQFHTDKENENKKKQQTNKEEAGDKECGGRQTHKKTKKKHMHIHSSPLNPSRTPKYTTCVSLGKLSDYGGRSGTTCIKFTRTASCFCDQKLQRGWTWLIKATTSQLLIDLAVFPTSPTNEDRSLCARRSPKSLCDTMKVGRKTLKLANKRAFTLFVRTRSTADPVLGLTRPIRWTHQTNLTRMTSSL